MDPEECAAGEAQRTVAAAHPESRDTNVTGAPYSTLYTCDLKTINRAPSELKKKLKLGRTAMRAWRRARAHCGLDAPEPLHAPGCGGSSGSESD